MDNIYIEKKIRKTKGISESTQQNTISTVFKRDKYTYGIHRHKAIMLHACIKQHK